jgi:hypothetical protein
VVEIGSVSLEPLSYSLSLSLLYTHIHTHTQRAGTGGKRNAGLAVAKILNSSPRALAMLITIASNSAARTEQHRKR